MTGTNERPKEPDAASPAARSPEQRDRAVRRGVRVPALVAVLMFGFALVLVSLHMGVYRVLSPFDEAAHLDYLIKVLDGHIVRRGESIGQEALRFASCRGAELEGLVLPPCGLGTYDPEEFPDRGFNYLHEHVPAFYVATAVPVRLFAAVGVEDVVDAGRWTAGLWFGLGLVAFWVAGRHLRIPPDRVLIATILLGTTPNIVHASSTVNDDSTAVLAGSAIVLAILWWERRGRGLLLLALASAAAVSLKPTHVLAVAAGILLLLGRAIAARRRAAMPGGPLVADPARPPRDYLWAAGALLGGALVLMAVWLPIHEVIALSDVDPQAARFRTESIGVADVVAQLGALLTPVLGPPLGPFTDAVGVRQVMSLLHLMVVAATFGAVFHSPMIDRPRSVGVAGAVTLLVGGAGLTLVNFYLRGNLYVPLLPSRYAFSVLPFLFLGVAAALSRASVRWFAGALAAVSLIVTLTALLTAS